MAEGSKSPTDVESPMCATVVQLVVVGAGCEAIVLVVTVVVVTVVVVPIVVVGVAVEVLLATGADAVAAAERMVVVVGNAATGVATSLAAGVTADSASSDPRPTLHPEAVASPTASTNGATRSGRATSRV
jgi:Flp pilus assembly protein TadB